MAPTAIKVAISGKPAKGSTHAAVMYAWPHLECAALTASTSGLVPYVSRRTHPLKVAWPPRLDMYLRPLERSWFAQRRSLRCRRGSPPAGLVWLVLSRFPAIVGRRLLCLTRTWGLGEEVLDTAEILGTRPDTVDATLGGYWFILLIRGTDCFWNDIDSPTVADDDVMLNKENKIDDDQESEEIAYETHECAYPQATN
jgi:hypothetical protein